MPTIYTIPDDVTGSTVTIDGKSHTVAQTELINISGSATNNATLTLDGSNWVGFKFTTPSNATALTWQTLSGWFTAATNTTDTTAQFSFRIYADSAGLPGALVTVWGSRITGGKTFTTTGTPTQLEISRTAWVPSNNTSYWAVFEFDTGPATGTYAVAYDNSTGANIVATSSNGGSTWGAVAGTGYFQLGNGGGHALIGNSYAGHALDAQSVNGIGVYGAGLGLDSWAGFFQVNAGSQGVQISAVSSATHVFRAGSGIRIVEVDTNGVARTMGLSTNSVTANNNYTVLQTDGIILVNSSSKTVTLPSASSSVTPLGRRFVIKNLSAITSTTVGATSGNVEGAATDTTSLASALAYAEYTTDGTNWWRVG